MYYDKIIFSSTRFPISVLADYDSAASRSEFRAENLSYHEQLEIIYFLEGVTALVVKDKTYMCGVGDIAVINPYELHTLYRSAGNPRYHCVMIDSLIYRAENDITNEKYVEPLDSRSVVFHNLISDDEIAACLKKIVREMEEKQPAYELAVKAQVFSILTALNRRFVCKELSRKEDERMKKQFSVIEKSIDYIRAHIGEDISLAAIADSLSLSEYHFSRTFKKFTGLTVFEYIEKLRMEKAKSLLKGTDDSVSVISDKCGYNDPSYFSKIFKNTVGKTPKQYRES